MLPSRVLLLTSSNNAMSEVSARECLASPSVRRWWVVTPGKQERKHSHCSGIDSD